MALTRAEQASVWPTLQDSPLIQKWPDFRADFLPNLDLQTYGPGEFIFRPGDRPLHLFTVARGRVLMRLRDSEEVWFEQEIRPGGFFGQQALFDEQYRSVARVPNGAEGAVLLKISADALRVALERASNLREDLLREGLASRLRRVPLFRTLTDEQVRWISHLVEERELPAGAALDLAQSPGIWVIDRGQMEVTGPLHPYPRDWEAWRITAGNFFVARGDPAHPDRAMRFGLNCSADTAVAHVNTHLFYLPLAHADRLIAGFGDVGRLIHQPLDVVAAIGDVDPFRPLAALQKQHLAQFFGWEFVPERQNVTTQGHPGHSFILLRQGAGLITAFDNYGRERPRSSVEPGTGYGRTSLFEGKQRDATVRAVRGPSTRGIPGLGGADILTLDRRDFQYAVAEKPQLWAGEEIVRRIRETEEVKPRFPWMQEGEVVKWEGRPHWLWLVWPLSLVGIAFLAFVVLAALLASDAASVALFLIAAFVLAPLAIGLVINYYDDYYVVTNKRVTRRDRQLLLFEARAEAPVEMIQDVTSDVHFWGQIFDFGHVTIRTASKGAPIRLDNVPQPQVVKEQLETARSEAQAEERGRQKEELRRGLISDLKLALPVPPRTRALGAAPMPGGSVMPPLLKRIFSSTGGQERVPTRPSTRAWLAQHSGALPDSWRTRLFGPPPPQGPKELPGMIIWHKHWLNAVQRTAGPFLFLMLLLGLGVLILADVIALQILNGIALAFGWLALVAIAAFWLWWQYTDYRNDVYIVTDDRIIDIEMQPLGLNAKRREGGLEKVQNVVAQQNGLWATLFRYGDVVISTAAANEGFTFMMVPNPTFVQATVFHKLNQFRVRDQKRQDLKRQEELIEALTVYHQLRGGSGGTGRDGFGERV
jgi:CRP-like cAMP-binding protein/membrane protein YdbS with pleckstrin-like domain